MDADSPTRYCSIDEARKHSKRAFGAMYRLEILMAVSTLEGEWTRSGLLDRIGLLFPGTDPPSGQHRLPASVVHKEIGILVLLGMVVPTEKRIGERTYHSGPTGWVHSLVRDLDLATIATVHALPTLDTGGHRAAPGDDV